MKKTCKYIGSLILLIANVTFVLGQNIENGTFFYPHEKTLYEFNHSINLSLSQLPENMVEEVNSLIYSPLIIYDVTLQLPKNFSLHGAYSTNIISNHFELGPKWIFKPNNLSFALGYNIAYWFGALDDYDFSSRNVGWLHYPNLTVGYSFERFTLSLKSEIILNTSYTQFVDNIEISTDKNTLSGYSFEVLLEQPLWKNNFMIIGFKLNISRFYYSTWLAYTNNVQFNYIPEIKIGLVL